MPADHNVDDLVIAATAHDAGERIITFAAPYLPLSERRRAGPESLFEDRRVYDQEIGIQRRARHPVRRESHTADQRVGDATRLEMGDEIALDL